MADYSGIENEETRQHGLTVLTAAVFLAAEMAGSGILALPEAILDAGKFYASLVFLTWLAGVRSELVHRVNVVTIWLM